MERSTIVRVREGLHARPATRFVKLAKGFESDIEIAKAGKSVSAKSSVKLMLLGVKEGQEVKAGTLLFQIDPAPFKADLDSAQASLRKAEANAFQARLQEQRYSQLVEGNAISGQEYDNARAAARQTAADVAANQAAVQRAKLNLGYATVPVAGGLLAAAGFGMVLLTARRSRARPLPEEGVRRSPLRTPSAPDL